MVQCWVLYHAVVGVSTVQSWVLHHAVLWQSMVQCFTGGLHCAVLCTATCNAWLIHGAVLGTAPFSTGGLHLWENNIRMSYSTSIVVVECTDRPSWVSSAEYLACAAWLCQHWLALPCPVHWSVASGHNPVLSKLTVRWQHMSQNKTWILLTWI